MRRFSSYGPIDKTLYYYAPREALIEKGYNQLVGVYPDESGHYFTVWAPRQTGKTWVMQQILFRLRKDPRFDVLKLNLEILKNTTDTREVLDVIAKEIGEGTGKKFTGIDNLNKFQDIFKNGVLEKPLILIIDEFDALPETAINAIVSAFRNIYIRRLDETDLPTDRKSYLLHGVALIGVRSVLGIENPKGSPFNVQRSLHIPNLTLEEVRGMFQWYEKESGQQVDPAVIDALYNETNGQPGFIGWFGELLSEGFEHYKNDRSKPIGMREFEIVYAGATYALPNNNIMNLISKAKEETNKIFLLKMFQTGEKLEFSFDDMTMNSLYMNGLVEYEIENQTKYFLKFACPFVQKRLFNYFSGSYFNDLGTLIEPFTNLDNVITDASLDILQLLNFYQRYLDKNKSWLFKNAPRRSDQRVFEAVFHFSFYSYFHEFLRGKKVNVFPEFPTGNGKIDILIQYRDQKYGIELKSFRDSAAYKNALEKAAHYGNQLGLSEIFLVSFIESIDDETRETYQKHFYDPNYAVTVKPFFIQTGLV